MADFKKGDRVKVAENATWADGYVCAPLARLRGSEAVITIPVPDKEGDVSIRAVGEDFGVAAVDPKFLTLVTDEPDVTDDAPVLVEVEDLSTLTEGQAVTLEAKTDGTHITGTWLEFFEGGSFTIGLAEGVYGNDFFSAQWRVLVEKPKVELPTQAGYYIDRDGHVWSLSAGQWRQDGDDREYLEPEQFAPYRRLVPEGSERNKTIRDVRDFLTTANDQPAAFNVEAVFPEAFTDAG